MNTRRISPVIITLCVLLAAQAASAKDSWTRVRSQNFQLVGNAPEKEIRQVATRLEQFRDVFTRLFPNANFKSSVPTTVVVFKSDAAYKPFKPVVNGKPRDVAGYFVPGPDVNYITLTTERGGENPFRTIYHEYVHLLVNNTLGKAAAPPWFNEGLAEYYSTFEISEDRKVALGNLIQNHILLLRQQRLMPLKQLFEVDHHSLQRSGHDARGIFYAQSWALVHYLILGNDGKRLPQLGRFVDLLGAKTPTEQAFARSFQTDIAAMEKELKDYIQRHTFRAQLATFERKLEFDSTMRSEPMSEAEAEAYLGDLLAHIDRREDAAARLERALKLDPKLSFAHASLGMLLARRQRFDDARRHLREAVATGEQNYLAHYYYAFALSREGMDETGRANGYSPEAAREMREHLRRAIELKPDFPESYHLLAFVNLVRAENLEESVKLLNRARSLAPGNEHYALVLAQVYMRQENFDAAAKTVEPLARDASDPQMRSNAQAILDAIKNMREHAERYKAMREAYERGEGRPPQLTTRDGGGVPARTPAKSEQEIEAEAAEAVRSAINDAMRKPLEGETRTPGVLTRIECGAKGLVFVVRVGERSLRLGARAFEDMHIMAFTSEAGGEITCGPRKPESAVVVTYRPSADARAKTDGTIAALEFVPADFKLKQ